MVGRCWKTIFSFWNDPFFRGQFDSCRVDSNYEPMGLQYSISWSCVILHRTSITLCSSKLCFVFFWGANSCSCFLVISQSRWWEKLITLEVYLKWLRQTSDPSKCDLVAGWTFEKKHLTPRIRYGTIFCILFIFFFGSLVVFRPRRPCHGHWDEDCEDGISAATSSNDQQHNTCQEQNNAI